MVFLVIGVRKGVSMFFLVFYEFFGWGGRYLLIGVVLSFGIRFMFLCFVVSFDMLDLGFVKFLK